MVDLKITVNPQEKTQWCYAAATQSVLNYYGVSTTQEAIACTYSKDGKTPINAPQDPVDILNAYNVFDGTDGVVIEEKGKTRKTVQKVVVNVDIIRTEVAKALGEGTPVIAMVTQSDGQNHYIVIKGYHDDGTSVTFHILDPADGSEYKQNADDLITNGFKSKDGIATLRGVVYTKKPSTELRKSRRLQGFPPENTGLKGGKRRRKTQRRKKRRHTLRMNSH